MSSASSDINKIATTSETPEKPSRINSIDALRGLVIVLMAIDHVRDIFAMTSRMPEHMQPLEPGWFFTRWITHFCAPIFVCFAGTSAYLYGRRFGREALCRFLIVRGLWLLIVELLLVNPSWSFMTPTVAGFVFVQVIWVIGWGMISLGLLLWLPIRFIAAIAIIVIAGHNAFDQVSVAANGVWSVLWKILHVANSWIVLSQKPRLGLIVIYPIIPWVAVLWLGYALGPLMTMTVERRRRLLLALGGALVGGFVAIRYWGGYGNDLEWTPGGPDWRQSLMQFVNTQKYPPSLAFLLMTLGPGLITLGLLERHKNRIVRALIVFGRVPFFFYVLHIPLLTLAGIYWHRWTYGVDLILFTSWMQGQQPVPDNYQPQLWLVYVVWAIFVFAMYWLCLWFGKLKASRNWWWLKYL